jgi:hypothetical protein
MIRCSLNDAKWIHESAVFDCNYIFVSPSSVEDFTNRIIRESHGEETKQSLEIIKHSMLKDME